uniref:ARID domain-containing protein n=1 Tax=Oncorhynchus tshawytscha TaxID=74940 RepID=A0A8C8BYX1_ONCTS
MKLAADEPAYLTVGTEVSAKYRGAFCEAKIKTVKRTVKVKVMLKGDTTSQVVQDDQVKGQLRVGSTVEVKSAEGICSEATINKLTDASWYTVVFDDGDEKTLRRTSLCLKGERHFAESETLDQLPLTNPEHFGTPVIGKKGNRGGRRSSQAHANDDKESSSSDDDSEDRRRLNDDLLGKVASIQTGTDRTSWYLALVISPSCNDDLTVKKDQCLVRSFADSKLNVLSKSTELTENVPVTLDFLWLFPGLDEAVHFLKTKVVPDSWKMDMSEILESSSSDEEEEDKEGKDEEEEEEKEDDDEDEADPEERDHFLQQLYKFMEDRGTPINKPPVLGYKDLNLFKLFRLVYQQGGCDKIESGSVWKQIYMDLGIPILNSAASYNVKTAYRKYLYGFEEYCRSACIVFRTIHHNEARPAPQSSQSQTEQKAAQVPEVKVKDKDKVGKGPTPPVQNESAAATEDKPSQEEAESGSESDKESHKDIASPRGRRRCTVTPVKAEVKEPVKLEKIKEQEPSGLGVGETSGEETDGQKESSRSDGADTQGNGCSRRLGESDKESEDEGEDEDSERRVGEGAEDEDSEDSVTGTKVKVKYGRGKTQKIYEANIKKTENDDAGDVLYLVHYYGWNVRYDEWVKADRIIWPVDKGGTKNKQKKKVMNKEDGEKDKQGKLGGLRGRPLLRTTPPSANRSVSKTPSREGRSSSKSKSDTSPLPNGEGTPRRRTRRTSGMYDSDRDSGNSSEDSESEDSTEKKPAWAERTDPATARKQEEEEDLRVERGRAEAVAAAAAQAAAQLQPPSSPKEQQQEDKLPEREPEKVEAEEQPQTPPMTPEPDRPKEEDPPNLKSPRPKASRRSNVREPERNTNNTGSEIPTTPNHTETESFPSPCPLKRQDEPMVVLHCLPAEHLPSMPDLPIMDSDTDSAPEEEICREERGVAKRKATDHRTPDKKVRLEWREDTARMASPGARPMTPERRLESGGLKEEECLKPAKGKTEPEVKTEMPALTPEVRCRGPGEGGVAGGQPRSEQPDYGAVEELMPQIGPEALVCHEVDLDDLDEKDKTSAEDLLMMMSQGKVHAPPPSNASSHHPQTHNNPPLSSGGAAPPQVFSPTSAPSPDESISTKSESDVTIEVDSVAGESQEGLGDNESAISNCFEANTSSSNSSMSLQERDTKDRGQKRLMDCNMSCSAKKQKRNQKRPSTTSKMEKNGAGKSSDSEDLAVMDPSCKMPPVKHSMSKGSLKLVSPNSKELEKDKHKHKQSSFPSPRTYKWTFQLNELDSMTSAERISFLQDKLQDIRKYYMSLKSEVASIDRRRKRLKKKEREVSHTTASTSSGSSDTGMSPSSASPTQNTVAVECR